MCGFGKEILFELRVGGSFRGETMGAQQQSEQQREQAVHGEACSGAGEQQSFEAPERERSRSQRGW